MKSIALALALFCVLLSSAAQLAMKRGMGAPAGGDVGATYLHALSSPLVWLGLVLYGASAVLWLWLLSPVTSRPAFTSLHSWPRARSTMV